MSVKAVKQYLSRFGMEERIRELSLSSATVELAAQALGVAPERIAKTLSFSVGEDTVLVVAAGDARIDNAAFRSQFAVKARMLPAALAEEKIGHAVGGVCPFAVKEGVKVYLDRSLRRFKTVYPACGSSNSAIEMTIAELEQTSGCLSWVDVCKGWQGSEDI